MIGGPEEARIVHHWACADRTLTEHVARDETGHAAIVSTCRGCKATDRDERRMGAQETKEVVVSDYWQLDSD